MQDPFDAVPLPPSPRTGLLVVVVASSRPSRAKRVAAAGRGGSGAAGTVAEELKGGVIARQSILGLKKGGETVCHGGGRGAMTLRQGESVGSVAEIAMAGAWVGAIHCLMIK